MTIGHCKHGEFILTEGCPQCIADRQAAEQASAQEPPVSIVKVKYSMTKNAGTDHEYAAFEGRAYTYFAAEPLDVGDIVEVPVQNHNMKAQVVEINVPESEIEAFRDKVKTIPAGSRIVEDGINRGPSYLQKTEVELPAAETPPVAQVASLFNPDDIQGRLVADEKASAEAGTLVGDLVLNEPEPPQEEEGPYPPGANDGETNDELVTPIPPALATIETQVGKSVPGLFQLYQEASSLLQYAKTRVIATAEDLKPATDDLAIILTCRKAMEARKKELVGPIRAKLDLVNSCFNDLMYPVMEADRLTKAQVGKFDQEQRAKAAEAKRIEDEKARLAREEAAFNGTGEVTVPTGTIEQVAPPPERTRTSMGTLSGRSNWKARVVDFKALPDEYKLPNESMLNAYARTHKGEGEIPGVEFYDDRNYSVRTK